MFFEFRARSHFLDLEPNILLFLELGRLMKIYLGMYFLFQNYMYIWRYKGVKGKNETGAARKNIIFDFFYQFKFYFGFLPQVSKHSMS